MHHFKIQPSAVLNSVAVLIVAASSGVAATEHSHHGLFTYDPSSPTGPSHWESLPIPSNQCGGSKNSPVAVDSTSCDLFQDYQLNAGTCGVDNLDSTIDNHSVKVSYPDDGCTKNTLVIPTVEGVFEAKQFHILTSSEHTVDGNFFGAEMHIVHEQVDGDRLAVIGMMVEPTDPKNHPLFESLLQKWTNAAEVTKEKCSLGSANGRSSNFNLNPPSLISTILSLREHLSTSMMEASRHLLARRSFGGT